MGKKVRVSRCDIICESQLTWQKHKIKVKKNIWKSYNLKYLLSADRSDDVRGCGLTFTIGRGNELVKHAVDSIRFLAIDRSIDDIRGEFKNSL